MGRPGKAVRSSRPAEARLAGNDLDGALDGTQAACRVGVQPVEGVVASTPDSGPNPLRPDVSHVDRQALIFLNSLHIAFT